MKKGLLSLLAAALTIVSCQNYDDQFAELTGLVTTLKAEVAGVTKVQSDLTALSTLVGTLSTSLEVANQTTQISNITSGLASATTQIEALEKLLGQVKTAQELTAVNSEVVSILAGVNTLLTKNASLQADLNIVDAETLETAQELILIGDQTPLKYILNGAATVDHTLLTPGQITTANLLTAKLISVTGAVTVSGTVDLSGLTSVLDTYTVRGSQRPTDQTITTIGGVFTIDGNVGEITYPNLRNVTGNVVFSGATMAKVTNLDFGTVATTGAGATLAGGSFTSTRCLSIKTGVFPMTAVDADSAVTIDLGQIAITALSIAADSADTINVNAATASTGDVTVQATATTNVFFNALATNTGKTETTGANVAQFHIPALLASAGTININADIVAATKLATIDAAADFTGTKAVDLSAVKAVTALLTVNTNPVNLPLAIFTNAIELLSSTATTVIVRALTEVNDSQLDNNHTNLTILSQDADFATVAANSPVLTTLSVTASGTGNDAVLDISIAPALKSLTTSNFTSVTSGGAQTTLVTATLSGTTQNISFDQNTALKSLVTNYTTMLEAGNALNYAAGQQVIITANTALTSVDLSTVGRLDDATITGNTALTVITAPATSTTTPLTGGAGNGADPLYTVKTNAVSVTYTAATAAVAAAGGTDAVLYGEMSITNASLLSWKNYILFNNTVNSPTFDIDYKQHGATVRGFGATSIADRGVAGTHVVGAGVGTGHSDRTRGDNGTLSLITATISTENELSMIK